MGSCETLDFGAQWPGLHTRCLRFEITVTRVLLYDLARLASGVAVFIVAGAQEAQVPAVRAPLHVLNGVFQMGQPPGLASAYGLTPVVRGADALERAVAEDRGACPRASGGSEWSLWPSNTPAGPDTPHAGTAQRRVGDGVCPVPRPGRSPRYHDAGCSSIPPSN